MSESKEWKKLNLPATSTYIEFPLAFTGKSKKPGASEFSGLLLSSQFILAIIHTMNKVCGEPAKLTYDFFVIKYGMSRETVSKGFKTLIERGIVKKLSRSRYKIDKPYRRKDYIEIDDCLFNMDIRLSYSRKLALGFLKREKSNQKTGGEFVSSQARVGKAINLPRTTAGDALREIALLGLIRTEKYTGDDLRRRNLFVYEVNPEVLAVKHLYKMNSLEVTEEQATSAEQRAKALHKRLLADTEYRNLIERINNNSSDKIQAILRSRGKDSEEIDKLEAERELLRAELDTYFKTHKVRRGIFPPGFFKTDDKEQVGA